jgi:uncharacterized protein GlcG (DUF336 family)
MTRSRLQRWESTVHGLEEQDVEVLIRGATRRASEMGVPVSVAVVDASGVLAGFARQDRAPLISVHMAQTKAFTSAALLTATEDLLAAVQPGAPLFGIHTNHPSQPITTVPGGLPIIRNGRIIGGLGVSGGTVEQDAAIASTALTAASFAAGAETAGPL